MVDAKLVFNRTSQGFFTSRNNGVAHQSSDVPRVHLPLPLGKRNEPSRRISSSVSSVTHTQKTRRLQYESDQRNEAELVDYLMNELAAVESELNCSAAAGNMEISTADRKPTLALDLAARTPRAGFFRTIVNSPAFANDRDREEYLIKEAEVRNRRNERIERV